jgi:hypothetical protein
MGARVSTIVGAALCALTFALPAWSGNLVQVRVGNHPTYTRVVFELDASSGYRIERHAKDAGDNTIVVTLDAASRERNITSKSKGVESVRVAAGNRRSVAHIVTRESGLPIREMILTNPPRVVLDLMLPEAAPLAEVAKAPAPKPAPKAKPEPKPEPTVAEVAEPVVAPEPEIAPAPTPVEEVVEVAEVVEVIEVVEEKTTPVLEAAEPEIPEVVTEPVAEAEVAVEDPSALQGLAAAELGETADAADPQADAPLAVIEVADLEAAREPAMADSEATPVKPIEPTAREASRGASPPTAEASEGGLPFGIDMKQVGMIAAGVLALIVLVALVLRSRRSKPEDELDVTALAGDSADADEGSHEGRIPEGGFAMNADVHEATTADEDFEFGGMEEPDDEEKSIETTDVAQSASPGLFDESPKEEEAMSMENQDLPVTHMDSEAPTQLGIGAAAVGAGMDSNIASLVQEMERRMAHMEARLDESNEARERLERTVEAQAEELRVQRAAIARTQRALRSLNRSEEDQATEPALRDPATPTS